MAAANKASIPSELLGAVRSAEEERRSPEQILWLCVLHRALLDFFDGGTERLKTRAEVWLLSRSESDCSLRWICSLFPGTLNADWLQRLIRTHKYAKSRRRMVRRYYHVRSNLSSFLPPREISPVVIAASKVQKHNSKTRPHRAQQLAFLF